MGSSRVVAAGAGICCLVIAGAAGPVGGAEGGSPPEAVSPVSPRAGLGEALVEARCPTFSWAGVEGAQGYELVVLAVPDASPDQPAEPRLATRAQLSAGARSWTPSLGSCLERGGRYAWSVRAATPGAEGPWSEPALFRVAAGPSHQEVEAAVETLRRHLEGRPVDGGGLPDPAAEALGPSLSQPNERLLEELASARERRAAGGEGPAARVEPLAESGLAPLGSQGTDAPPQLAFAAAPVLGSPSLSVSANIALGPESNLFKEGAVFLWDDDSGNTALGRDALGSATGTATGNTAVGRGALTNTTEGGTPTYGSSNTAVGHDALNTNTTGFANTASGFQALRNNLSGTRNTASGFDALRLNLSGYRNTATGNYALRNNSDGHRNTATGDTALSSNASGNRNTATGTRALASNTSGNNNTASGYNALSGNLNGVLNTATGSFALLNSTGHENTATGAGALRSNTSGGKNTATGADALRNNTTGARNVAIGYRAGRNLGFESDDVSLSDNVFIANEGEPEDKQTIRIGNQDEESVLGTHIKTFIAGIHGVTVTGSTVLVSSSGQLGVSSSSARFKEGVEELGAVGERLAALRPVTFRYRSEVLPDGGAQLGLLAEEVAKLFPELVTRDAEGRPFGVRYDLLSVLSLAELQQQAAIVRAQGTELAEQRLELAEQRHETANLHQRVAALEAGEPREAQKRHFRWRRSGGSRDSP